MSKKQKIADTKWRIQHAEDTAEELAADLAQVQDELRQARLHMTWLEHGVRPGVVVTRAGQTYRVVEVGACSSERPPFLKCNPCRKNGEWSKREVWVFDNWSLVEDEE